MKKNGFISTSLIYTFFILVLLLMLFLLNSYSSVRFLMEQYKYDIKNSFAAESVADINLYFMVWDESSNEYELQKEMPEIGYNFEEDYSYCKNGSRISYSNGNISVAASRSDSCYAYFTAAEKDINLKIYTKESSASERVLVKSIPNYIYDLTSSSCTNGATIDFNENTRKFTIKATDKTVCEVEFTKKEVDIILNLFKEDVYGSHEYNGVEYKEVKDLPGSNYTMVDGNYYCLNQDVNTIIKYENNDLVVESNGKNECNIYFTGENSTVELIIMQETDTGVNGYTTGLKYTRTSTIPSTGYKYAGYICEDVGATVTYSGGTLEATSNKQTICRAYFNKYVGNAFINYYLETSNGNYESVVSVPNIGYVYNSEKSQCVNGSNIEVNNNIVTIDATGEDECNVYFDMASVDIKVNVYVMNRTLSVFELSSIPAAGYELYHKECTNGASIEYTNGSLNVAAEGPTVCTVYFR
ncbi:MAG: hypothetical protein E7161_04565 [Firmicutes bacterium]|nr:hypothetical protein [Bacillota bacterium]